MATVDIINRVNISFTHNFHLSWWRCLNGRCGRCVYLKRYCYCTTYFKWYCLVSCKYEIELFHLITSSSEIWDEVFKIGPSKIYGRQPLKNLKGYCLLKQTMPVQIFLWLSSTNLTRSILEYFVPNTVLCKY